MTIPTAFDCANRIPPDLRDDVESADPPDGSQGGGYVAFDAQTGQLEQSNDEKGTVIWIYDHCEAERRAVIEELNGRTFWQQITPWRE